MRLLVALLLSFLSLHAQTPRLTDVQERRLANGVRVLLVERRGLSAFHATLVFGAAGRRSPPLPQGPRSCWPGASMGALGPRTRIHRRSSPPWMPSSSRRRACWRRCGWSVSVCARTSLVPRPCRPWKATSSPSRPDSGLSIPPPPWPTSMPPAVVGSGPRPRPMPSWPTPNCPRSPSNSGAAPRPSASDRSSSAGSRRPARTLSPNSGPRVPRAWPCFGARPCPAIPTAATWRTICPRWRPSAGRICGPWPGAPCGPTT